jgi:hypothetical protein
MHPSVKFQFERAVPEFSQWRAVPVRQRKLLPPGDFRQQWAAVRASNKHSPGRQGG